MEVRGLLHKYYSSRKLTWLSLSRDLRAIASSTRVLPGETKSFLFFFGKIYLAFWGEWKKKVIAVGVEAVHKHRQVGVMI